MNKRDLIDRVANQATLTHKLSTKAVNTMLEAIIETVSAGEPVRLSGFGTFASQQRQPRQGRHPKTGAPLQIPAKTSPTFSASQRFKSKVALQLHILRIPPLRRKPQQTAAYQARSRSGQTPSPQRRSNPNRLRSITEGVLSFFNGQSEENR
ncbi:MAG: HU family DNA-binding protein [Cyanobacteria bacterium P01_A01_bin.105]